ncbi:MAG TPA: PQQ-binding-like beta-propeller repeat protein [Hyphomonadaceae bacterium]|nr:PQQ-binding-like beta-propeller repeat protein [Hyphomonadaceae bacterium]
MKAVISAAVLSGVMLAGISGAAAQQAADPEAVFAARCKGCHEPAIGEAPDRAQLRARTSGEIVAVLTTGPMQSMAAGLSAEDIGALAKLLGSTPSEGAVAGAGGNAPASSGPTFAMAPPDVADRLLKGLSPVTPAVLQSPAPGDWLHWSRTNDGQNFSPLKQINRTNVGSLTQAWRLPVQGGNGMPVPMVHDGVMFLNTNPDTVLALDATNGQLLWKFVYDLGGRVASQKMGLALAGELLLMPTSNLHVVALNVHTGAKVWDHEIALSAPATDRGVFNLRSAPLVVGDRVIQGVTGSAGPGGGYIVGLDIATGQEVWRFYTIARPGEPGGNSWNGAPLEKRSGGSVWDQGTYDPKTGLVYFGIGQTYDTAVLATRSSDPGVTNDGLYTDSTVALDPKTGKLIWHFQHLPNDQWDLDWVFERQLADVKVNGKNRRVVMTIGKMGILDALDAKTGAYLFSIDPGVQNVIASIDPKTGAKAIDPVRVPDPNRPTLICPSASGSRSWPATSVDQQAGLLFVPLTEICMQFSSKGGPLLSAPGAGISNAEHPDAVSDGMMSRLQAFDLTGKKLAWRHDLTAPLSTSALSTAGGLVFAGDLDPALKAFDAKDGKLLWTGPLDNYASSFVTTYSVGKTQYVAVVTGMRNYHINDISRRYQEFMRGRGKPVPPNPTGAPAIQVFKLPG